MQSEINPPKFDHFSHYIKWRIKLFYKFIVCIQWHLGISTQPQYHGIWWQKNNLSNISKATLLHITDLSNTFVSINSRPKASIEIPLQLTHQCFLVTGKVFFFFFVYYEQCYELVRFHAQTSKMVAAVFIPPLCQIHEQNIYPRWEGV